MNSYKTFIFLLFLSFGQFLYGQNSLIELRTFTGKSELYGRIGWNFGGIGDMNRDGEKDFVIAYAGGYKNENYNKYVPGFIELYYGSDDIINIKPVHVFPGEVYSPVGDINKDGFDDLLIGELDTTILPIKVYCFKLYLGGKVPDTIPHFIYWPPYGHNEAFIRTDRLGDINGDGYNDFAIASKYNWSDGKGRVYIFFGGDKIPSQPAITLGNPVNDTTRFKGGFGSSVTGIGDINSDGIDDFLVGGDLNGIDSARVYVYLGGRKLRDQPDFILKDPGKNEKNNFGHEVKFAGDINNDGRNEFIIACMLNIYIYFGLDSVLSISAMKYGDTGYIGVGTGGDINGDGYNDFLMSNTNHLNESGVMVGEACVFFGSGIIDTTEKFRMEGWGKWLEFGKYMSIVGDINGDGYDEVFICEYSWPDFDKPIGRLHLYQYKKLTAVDNRDNKIQKYSLYQNYPNPFNNETLISYLIKEHGMVCIKIYDILGRDILTIVNEEKQAGQYSAKFSSGHLPSGTYMYRITINGYSSVRKLVLSK